MKFFIALITCHTIASDHFRENRLFTGPLNTTPLNKVFNKNYLHSQKIAPAATNTMPIKKTVRFSPNVTVNYIYTNVESDVHQENALRCSHIYYGSIGGTATSSIIALGPYLTTHAIVPSASIAGASCLIFSGLYTYLIKNKFCYRDEDE